jgi:anaerobic magnesium-protoporphyrin IX monomethyl ester cyclase
MDILLSHGYFIAEDEHEQAIMKPYPTLGLLYISSHLKAKGFAVDLFDTTFRTMADFVAYVRQKRPSLVGLYCNLMTKQNILRMIPVCREVGATLILGGPEPASYAAEYLAFGADIVVVGEGELTLEELIPHLARYGRSQLHTVQDIIFQDEDGQLTQTAARPYIKDLAAQPWPDRDAIDMARYLDTWQTHHGYSSVSLITARGCPYTCTWCSHAVFGHTHRRRTVEDVADEVAWIQETYRPDQLWYADDVLTIVPRWFLSYAAELKRRGLRIPFEAISRPDRLNEEIIAALAEMGCRRLWLGSESGSQRILDRMKRKTEVADLITKSHLLQAAGIEVGMFIMLGYDGEAVSDIEATADYLKQANPDLFLTTVAYPIKGTAYYEEVADRVATPLDWAERTDRDLQVNGRYSRQFYDHATRWLVNEVNLHQSWQAGQRHPLRLGKLWLNAQRGRWGMRLTHHQRESGQTIQGSGRGWPATDRATGGW